MFSLPVLAANLRRFGDVAAGAHRYWGISISANNGSANYAVAELEFFDASGARISDGLPGFAKAGWADVSGQLANPHLTDTREGAGTGNGNVAYEGGSLPFILWVDFGSAVLPSLMRVISTEEAFNATAPQDYAMVYSDDASTWTSVASTTGETGWKENEDRTLENPASAPAWTGQNAFSSTQWRIRLEDYYSAYFAWAFSELETYETIGGARVTPTTITSNRPWNEPLTNLLDGDDTTFASDVDNPPERNLVYLEMTYSSAVALAEIGLRARNDAGVPSDIGRQMPNELRVEYYTGSAWKYAGYLIDPNPSFAAPGELRRFPLLISR